VKGCLIPYANHERKSEVLRLHAKKRKEGNLTLKGEWVLRTKRKKRKRGERRRENNSRRDEKEGELFGIRFWGKKGLPYGKARRWEVSSKKVCPGVGGKRVEERRQLEVGWGVCRVQ